MRVSGAAIRPEEAAAARAARLAVGHALRDARYRREHDDDRFGFHLDGATAASLRRPRLLSRRPVAIGLQVATAAVIVLVVLFFVARPGGQLTANAPQPTPLATSEITGQGRGRTSASQAPLARATPTIAPPLITTAPFPVSTGVPGVGTGGGTGTGFIPPLSPGYDRFLIIVREVQTEQVIPGVCVTFGQPECGASQTNANGVWWVDFPRGVARPWDFFFEKAGYGSHHEIVNYSPGGQIEIEVHLRRSQ